MASPPEDEARPRVVLLVGEPGTGKTRLGWALSDALGIPFLARDQVRRGLYFTAGAWTSAPGPLPSGERAVEAFLSVIEPMPALGVSCIAEYVVRRDQPAHLRRLIDAADCSVVQTTCTDASSRRVARECEDRLLSRQQVLEASGRRDVNDALEAREAHMRQVTSEMLTEFPLPLLLVKTDRDYEPGLDEIITFVTATESTPLDRT